MRLISLVFLLSLTSFIVAQEKDSCVVYAPNVITPDCDGDCSCWRIYSDCELKAFDLKVFDNWGKVIFESTDPTEEWCPGFDPDLRLEVGAYVWQVSFQGCKDLDGDAIYEVNETRTVTGQLTYLY